MSTIISQNNNRKHYPLLLAPPDVSPLVLAEVVVRISSCRLKLVIADAIFRNLCCRNGVSVGDEPLSLRKMVSRIPVLIQHYGINELIVCIILYFQKFKLVYCKPTFTKFYTNKII